MNEVTFLAVLPIGVALILMLLRRQPARYWWFAYLGVTGMVVAGWIAVGGIEAPERKLVGTLVLALLPLSLMFLVLRAELFERRIYLVPLLGPLIYLAGVGLALSIVVTLGLLQP